MAYTSSCKHVVISLQRTHTVVTVLWLSGLSLSWKLFYLGTKFQNLFLSWHSSSQLASSAVASILHELNKTSADNCLHISAASTLISQYIDNQPRGEIIAPKQQLNLRLQFPHNILDFTTLTSSLLSSWTLRDWEKDVYIHQCTQYPKSWFVLCSLMPKTYRTMKMILNTFDTSLDDNNYDVHVAGLKHPTWNETRTKLQRVLSSTD